MDGTLIDLCGAILLWRSREGIAKMPVSITLSKNNAITYYSAEYCLLFQSLRDIDDMRKKLNATKPQCPVGLMTLEFPSNPTRPSNVCILYIFTSHM